jgi:hypothetical protein
MLSQIRELPRRDMRAAGMELQFRLQGGGLASM